MLEHASTSVLTMPVSDDRDHFRGPRDAAVTLVEYGDYECGHCGQAHVILHRLMSQAGGRVRLVFRNFPLTQIHPHAQSAAEAAEAAGAQGKFWEMHDILYERQAALGAEQLLSHAEEIGLDVPRFQRELAQRVHAGRVREDFLSGVRSGVNGNPHVLHQRPPPQRRLGPGFPHRRRFRRARRPAL